MPTKDPQNWTWLSAVIAIGSALGGGFIRYTQEMRITHAFRLQDFLIDMLTSGFVGFFAYWIFRDVLLQPEALCAAAAGFAGNLGANVFVYLKLIVNNRLPLEKDNDKRFP